MKKLAHVTAIVFLFGLPYVKADDRHHPQSGQEAAASAAATSASQSMRMGMMDMDRMQEMHKTMERIQQSKDPAERQRLMQEHMEQMQKMMGDMHGMMGKGMGAGMSAEDRQKMMENRMDMMQGMMDQMMEHMMVQGGAVKQERVEQDKQHEHEDSGKRRRLEMKNE